MASKSKYLPTGRCFTAEYAHETVAWFINKQRESVARDTSLISRKERMMSNDDKQCHSAPCDNDCKTCCGGTLPPKHLPIADKLCTCGTCDICKAVLIDLEMVPQHIGEPFKTHDIGARGQAFSENMDGICVSCGADLEEMSSSLGQQADYSGMASLTEDEQCYIDGKGKGRCPSCINGGELLPATYASGISEAGMVDVLLENEDDPDLDMLPTRLPLTDEEAHHLD